MDLPRLARIKKATPPVQALLAFALFLVTTAVSQAVDLAGLAEVGSRFPWICALAFLLLYCIFNPLFFLYAASVKTYWQWSVYSYAGLAFAGGFCAYLVSGLALNDAGSTRWLYMVITVAYLVFMSIVGFMRFIVELAQRRDTRDFDNRRHRHRR